MTAPDKIVSATRRLEPALVDLLKSLQVGDRIALTQTVRVGSRTWTAETAGAYRGVNYLATGITTDRVPEDDIVAVLVRFTKDNGEYSSVTIDERSQVERIGG